MVQKQALQEVGEILMENNWIVIDKDNKIVIHHENLNKETQVQDQAEIDDSDDSNQSCLSEDRALHTPGHAVGGIKKDSMIKLQRTKR